MPYSKTTWVATVTPLSAANLNKLETQYEEAVDDAPGKALFGDGSDGIVTIAANTNLTRDMYYNTLTIDPTKILYTKGFRIFVKGLLDNNGFIDHNGADGAAGAAPGPAAGGAGAPDGSMGGHNDPDGGDGRHNAAGEAGTNEAIGLGSAGGAGGAGSAHAGGAAGTLTASAAARGGYKALPAMLIKTDFYSATFGPGGGSGGGGGGGDNTNSGGGGGGGAGIMYIAAQDIDNTGGVIRCNGGDGGDASAGNAGGGGGGGGGYMLLVYNTLTANTETASGGVAGAKTGTGVAGAAGAAGTVVKLGDAV